MFVYKICLGFSPKSGSTNTASGGAQADLGGCGGCAGAGHADRAGPSWPAPALELTRNVVLDAWPRVGDSGRDWSSGRTR